jgi:hypothetical protein
MGRLILVSDPVIDDNRCRQLTDLGAEVEMCPEPAEVGDFQEARLRRLAGRDPVRLPDSSPSSTATRPPTG